MNLMFASDMYTAPYDRGSRLRRELQPTAVGGRSSHSLARHRPPAVQKQACNTSRIVASKQPCSSGTHCHLRRSCAGSWRTQLCSSVLLTYFIPDVAYEARLANDHRVISERREVKRAGSLALIKGPDSRVRIGQAKLVSSNKGNRSNGQRQQQQPRWLRASSLRPPRCRRRRRRLQ